MRMIKYIILRLFYKEEMCCEFHRLFFNTTTIFLKETFGTITTDLIREAYENVWLPLYDEFIR